MSGLLLDNHHDVCARRVVCRVGLEDMALSQGVPVWQVWTLVLISIRWTLEPSGVPVLNGSLSLLH